MALTGTGSEDETYAFNKLGVTVKSKAEETLGSSGADVAASVTDLLRVRRLHIARKCRAFSFISTIRATLLLQRESVFTEIHVQAFRLRRRY